MNSALTDQEVAQGWADIPLRYAGAAQTGNPASVRLCRPPGRKAVWLFSDWIKSRDGLVMVKGCLPDGQTVGAWIEELTPHGYERLAAVAFEIVLGREFAAQILNSIPAPAESVEQAAADLRANPLAWLGELTPVQSDCGQVSLKLQYWQPITPASLPDSITLTVPLDVEKPDLAAEYLRLGNAGLFYLIDLCLPSEWRGGALLDALAVPSIYRLWFAAFELCMGRAAFERYLGRVAAKADQGGIFIL